MQNTYLEVQNVSVKRWYLIFNYVNILACDHSVFVPILTCVLSNTTLNFSGHPLYVKCVAIFIQ